MIYIDIETYSDTDIREVGAYRYAEDHSTKVLVICWAKDNGPVQTWTWQDGVDPPTFSGQHLCAHNAEFERAVLLAAGFVDEACVWHDTAAQAAACALPRSLEGAASALGLPVQKNKRGSYLINKLSKPQRPSATRPYTEPHLRWPDYKLLLNEFADYCATDVEVCRELAAALPPLSDDEQGVYQLTVRMNARGIAVDLPSVLAAHKLVEKVTGNKGQRMVELTGASHNQVAEVLAWANAQIDPPLASLDKAAVSAALRRKVLPEPVREALLLRQELAKSSTAKLDSILSRVCADGRVRGNLIYHGAATGRWSGSGVQLQNVVRVPKGHDLDDCMWAIHGSDPGWIAAVWGMPPPAFVSSSLRGLLVAGEGKTFIGADYAAIEARVLLWLARDAGLDIFVRGEDIYKEMASRIYDTPVFGITAAQRQLGKQAVLGLGYGMGAPKFVDTCAGYGIVITEDFAAEVVGIYRTAFMQVTRYWRALEDAAKSAVHRPGKVIMLPHDQFVPVGFRFDGDRFLECRLPSGRKLRYPFPLVEPGKYGPQITYMTVNSMTKQWVRTHTYGGKLCENICQAVARDIMAHALLHVAEPVLTVHDEVVCEVRPPVTEEDIRGFEAGICELPGWAKGLPLAAEGWTGRRYGKN